jgi:hypothetical protein
MLVAIRKVVIHYFIAERIDFTMHYIFPSHPVGRQGKTAYTIE